MAIITPTWSQQLRTWTGLAEDIDALAARLFAAAWAANSVAGREYAATLAQAAFVAAETFVAEREYRREQDRTSRGEVAKQKV